MKFEESRINESFNELSRKDKSKFSLYKKGIKQEVTLIDSISAIRGGRFGDFGNGYNWELKGVCQLTINYDDKTSTISQAQFTCIIKVELDDDNNEIVSKIKENRINIK